MKQTVSQNESDLIQRSRQHDEEAFTVLVSTYTPPVYRIVRRMVTDTMEAESIVQETFWRFWQKLPIYREDAPLLPYLATIASNLARDRCRRDRRLEEARLESVPENLSDPALDVELQLDQEHTLKRLAEIVETLPFAYRAVISLRYDAGMSYEEIAQSLSLPLNTVRTHLRRARAILRAEMESEDG